MSLYDLPLTLPPLFAEACGYKGAARYVALCWLPETEELWWSGSGESVRGNPAPLVLLCNHPFTTAAVTAYVSRVAPDAGGRRCLLIDRDRRALSVGDRAAISDAIAGQRPTKRHDLMRDPRLARQLLRNMSTWLDWMEARRRARS